MHLIPVNPDIQSVLIQIERSVIDLDPEFQRGDVWNIKKQQMLIDTILREWQVPAIFFIKHRESGNKEVLDGHQRLMAIRNFYNGIFPVDGSIQPTDERITNLSGLFYADLPDRYRNIFNNFALNTYEIIDYQEEEPFELFFRLNQNAVLTSAERRNTLFGPARDDVKSIVELMEFSGYNSDTIGFNNTRHGYHDIIARILYTLEEKDISKKITDNDITMRYRLEQSFSQTNISKLQRAITKLIIAVNHTGKIKLNKPSLFSILIFIIECTNMNDDHLILKLIEGYRDFLLSYKTSHILSSHLERIISEEYKGKISTSVYDGKSVVFRHFFFCWMAHSTATEILNKDYLSKVEVTTSAIQNYLKEPSPFFDLGDILKDYKWGALI